MHRTAVILSNGDVTTCAAPFAETVGNLTDASLSQTWLGSDMQQLRAENEQFDYEAGTLDEQEARDFRRYQDYQDTD